MYYKPAQKKKIVAIVLLRAMQRNYKAMYHSILLSIYVAITITKKNAFLIEIHLYLYKGNIVELVQ